MKSAILVAFVLCAALAVCESKKCRNQEDCEADECCTRLLRFVDPTCKKLKQKGDHCLPDVKSDKGIYASACPCVEGLKCRPEKEADDNGVFNFLNDRCGE